MLWARHGRRVTSSSPPRSARRLTRRKYQSRFSELAKEAGLGKWHVHELRHSSASTSLAQGVPVEVVSAFLGHSSIRMTVDTYGHIGDSQLRTAADTMDAVASAVLWPQPPSCHRGSLVAVV